MLGIPEFDVMLVGWGLAVLAVAAIRHVYFGGTCIHIAGNSQRN